MPPPKPPKPPPPEATEAATAAHRRVAGTPAACSFMRFNQRAHLAVRLPALHMT